LNEETTKPGDGQEWEAPESEPETLTPLAAMARQQDERRFWMRLFCGASAASFGLLSLHLTGCLDVSSAPLALLVVGFTAATLGIAIWKHETYSATLAGLEETDTQAVGALIEALNYSNIYREAEAKLVTLLPGLRPEDAALLTEAHYTGLYQALSGSNTALILAVLKALEQIGTSEAIPYVETLAGKIPEAAKYDLRIVLHGSRACHSEAVRPESDNQRIRETAQICLNALRQRDEQERAAQTLLRPAPAPALLSHTLLRPAAGVAAVDASLLLRPGVSEGETSAP
jgi:hypothetical protein